MNKKQGLRYNIYKLVDVSYETDGGKLNFDFYDVFMLVVIIISLVPLAFKEENQLLQTIDIITVAIFIIDYILRWITADFHFDDFSFKSFLIYPFSIWAIIDLVSIVPSFTTLNSSFRLFKIFRIFRTLRVLRAMRAVKVIKVVKIARYSKSMNIIGKVLKESKEPLLAVCLLAFAYILVSSLLIFNVEPDSFNTFFDAIYWATVSLTTVGYGDIYPITTIGRLVAMFSSIFGIAIVALPAGIITAGYMNEINKSKDNE